MLRDEFDCIEIGCVMRLMVYNVVFCDLNLVELKQLASTHNYLTLQVLNF